MQITWDLSPHISLWHAVWAAGTGQPLADPRVSRPAIDAAAAFHSALASAGIAADAFWEHALPLAGQDLPAGELLSAALPACGLPQDSGRALVPTLAWLLEDAQEQVAASWPTLAEELVLRHRPLREQWEARGPGLWAWLCRQFPGLAASGTCRVLGVLPILGGGGWLHRAHCAVRIECVLANPRAELPEVVRLAWLVAQAACQWPAEKGGSYDLRLLAALALLPGTLAAADELELALCTPDLVAAALASWMPPEARAWAGRLWAWWEKTAGRPCPWPEAVLGLQQALDLPPSPDDAHPAAKSRRG